MLNRQGDRRITPASSPTYQRIKGTIDQPQYDRILNEERRNRGLPEIRQSDEGSRTAR